MSVLTSLDLSTARNLVWKSLCLGGLISLLAWPALAGESTYINVVVEIAPVPRGVDIYESAGSLNLFGAAAIPADFFDPGSAPFTGIVDLTGLYLGDRGPFEMGTTDTVVHRHVEANLADAPSSTQIEVEIVELSLVSTAPINVIVAGQPQDWNIFVTLNTDLPLPVGQMVINRVDPSNGDYGLTIPIEPRLVFERQGEIRVLLPGQELLAGAMGSWSVNSPCATDPLNVPRFPIGPCMSGLNLSSSMLDLNLVPPTVDLSRPPPSLIEPGAIIDPDVASIGRDAVIFSGAQIGPGVVIGPRAFVGADTFVGANALVAEDANLAEGARVGDNAIVGAFGQLGLFSTLDVNSQVGQNCQVANNVAIGTDTTLHGNCVVEDGAAIGNGVTAELGVHVESNSTVQDGLYLYLDAIVPAFSVLTEDLIPCEVGGVTVSTETPTDCDLLGGESFGLIPGLADASSLDAPTSGVVAKTPLNPGNLPAELQNLAADVNGVDSRDGTTKVKDRVWTATTYDCDDFADDMEKGLTGKGYDATFTCYWEVVPNSNHSWYNWLWTSPIKLTKGHAIADVHANNGDIIWIEPQNGLVGVTKIINSTDNLDDDGDGKVEYATSSGSKKTDGDYRIEVWPSRAAAEKAGRRFD